MIETYRGVVYPWECDFFNHLNVQHYVAKFDIGTWQFLSHCGLGPSYFRNENRGMVGIEQNLRYYQELIPGDLVLIKSELLEVRSKSLRYRHVMYNITTDEIVAEAKFISVHINTQTRQSCEFPAEVKASLQLQMEES